jgi:hypothetical protein
MASYIFNMIQFFNPFQQKMVKRESVISELKELFSQGRRFSDPIHKLKPKHHVCVSASLTSMMKPMYHAHTGALSEVGIDQNYDLNYTGLFLPAEKMFIDVILDDFVAHWPLILKWTHTDSDIKNKFEMIKKLVLNH